MKTTLTPIRSMLLLWVACWVVPGGLQAQEALTLQQAITKGLANHHSVFAQQQRLSEAEAQTLVEKSHLLPQVRATADVINNFQIPVQVFPGELLGAEPGTQVPLRFGTDYQVEYGLALNWALVDLSRWRALRTASLQQQLAGSELSNEKALLTRNISDAWHMAVVARQQAQYYAELAGHYDTLTRLAGQRFEQGYIEQLEYNRAVSARLQVVQTLHQSREEEQNALLQLNFWMGQPATASYDLQQSNTAALPARPDTESSYDARQHPRYEAIALQTQVQQSVVAQRRKAFLPTLNLRGNYSRQAFSNELNFMNSNTEWFNVGWAGLNVSWGIFEGLRNKQSLKLASIALTTAQHNEQAFLRNQHIEYQKARNSQQQQYQALQTSRQNLALMEENHSIGEYKFTRGLISASDLKAIQHELIDAHQQYLQHLSAWYQTTNQLNYLKAAAQ